MTFLPAHAILRSVSGAVTAISLALALGPACAADRDAAPVWSGPYLGIEASPGGLFGDYDVRLRNGATQPVSALTTGFGLSRTDSPSLLGGFAGYNAQIGVLPSGAFVVGFEGSWSAAWLRRAIGDYADEVGAGLLPGNIALLHLKTNALGSLRARAGYAFQNVLVYGTAGIGAARTQSANLATASFGSAAVQWGLTAGAGFEAKLASHIALGVDYRYSQFSGAPLFITGAPVSVPVVGRTTLSTHQTSLRLSWYPQTSEVALPGPDKSQLEGWSVHGQSTYIAQGVPNFRSPYVGPQSLRPDETRQTWTNTLYLGRRLWDGGEFYINPEFIQGYGLSNSSGIAGFTNGEATKAGFRNPRFRLQRYFLRQTFGLGGETEDIDDGQNAVAGKRDIDRITITAGKIAVNDIFDDNKYSHDPRIHFLNLSLWEAAAYDFPANLAGYTQGVVVDLNRKDWAVRGAFVQVPKQPNSDALDFRIPRAGGGVVEFEGRYTLFDQPGKLRVGYFMNRGRTGSNREAIAISTLDSTTDPNTAIALTRRDRLKSGFYINAEQAATETVGFFARLSRNDGRNEILSFTDIDSSVSGGLRVKGVAWGRSEDVVGLAGATNGLSASKTAFLSIGGSGLIIGDGRLNYRRENILETFYAAKLTATATLSFDYQFVSHPAYNADRGPVSVFGSRLHFEF